MEVEEDWEFKVILRYIVTSRLALATCDRASKIEIKKLHVA